MNFFVTVITCLLVNNNIKKSAASDSPSFYDFSGTDIDGKIVSFKKFRGKVTLVVNVASMCGYTEGHYKGLNLLNKKFSHTGKFNILAFPCNQFGEQEPGLNEEIDYFAYEMMKATFPLFAKIDVMGENAPSSWKYLTGKSYTPNWNFWKYLIDSEGYVIGAWGPNVSPEELYELIENTLKYAQSSDGSKDEF